MADSTETKRETVQITGLTRQNSPSPMEKPTPALPESPAQARKDQVPMPLCWVLVAISAMVLILQIWNYLS